MTRTARKEMLTDVMTDRVRNKEFKAWYIYSGFKPTETGTLFSKRNK